MRSFELLWWAFTLVLICLIVGPIYLNLPDFPYIIPNIIAIAVAVTFTRYVFLLRVSWLDGRYVWMALMVFAAIPICFYVGQYLNYFTTTLDNEGPDVWVKGLSLNRGKAFMNYLETEYYLFGVWAILAGVVMPFRFIYQIWKDHIKKQGVRGGVAD
ncbi:MAG: hypothetical protein AAGF87_14925 [Bacteroidota bacterium]